MRSASGSCACTIGTLVASGVLGLTLNPASADILFTTGSMVAVPSPPSLIVETFESSTEIRIIDEGVKTLVTPLFVDGFGPGPQFPAGPLAILPAGLTVQTYIVHFDPDGGVVSLTGGVTFEAGEIIVGIAMHTPYLDASDGFPVGDPFIAYPTGDLDRGFETLPGTDSGFIAADLNSVDFTLFAELGLDQARIFTIPEPATAVSLIATGLALLRWRRL